MKNPLKKVGLHTNQELMKKQFFKVLAKLNKIILPSYTKRGLDLSKASKVQLAIFGWKVYVTKNALD